METICSANQWTGFYMISAAVMKGLNMEYFVTNGHFDLLVWITNSEDNRGVFRTQLHIYDRAGLGSKYVSAQCFDLFE